MKVVAHAISSYTMSTFKLLRTFIVPFNLLSIDFGGVIVIIVGKSTRRTAQICVRRRRSLAFNDAHLVKKLWKLIYDSIIYYSIC